MGKAKTAPKPAAPLPGPRGVPGRGAGGAGGGPVGGAGGPTSAAELDPLRPFAARLSLACLEVMLALMEVLFGPVLLTSMLRSLPSGLPSGLPSAGGGMAGAGPGLLLLANALTICWVLFRFGSGIGCDLKTLVDRMGLLQPALSPKALLVAALQGLGLAGMIASQYFTGRWFMDVGVWTVDGQFDFSRLVESVLVAPVREEVAFRAVVFALFYKRIGGPGGAAKLNCVMLSSVLFGGVHLLNFFGSRFSASYILLQVAMGGLIGCFYSLRFLHSSIAEPIFLHAVNNLCSSFLPLHADMDLRDPLLLFPFVQALVVYGIFVYKDGKRLLEGPPSPFAMVPNPTSLAYEAAPATTARTEKNKNQ